MSQPTSGYRPFAFVSLVFGAALALSCSPASVADCTSDADCEDGERCVTGGGVFVRGGVCVTEGATPSDGGDAAADISENLDASPDTEIRETDTRPRDTDDRSDADAEPPRDGTDKVDGGDTAEGRDTSDRADTGDARDPADVGDVGCAPGVEGCPCNYQNAAAGVCGSATFDSDGACREPANYAETETSCDGRDNDCDGIVDEWCESKLLGGPGEERGTGVATDTKGNVYVAGYVEGTIAGRSTKDGSRAGVVIKYDENARRQWIELIDTPAADEALDIAVGSGDNVYVTGSTAGNLARPNAGQEDRFLRKMNPTGTEDWTLQRGDAEDDRGYAVTVDARGNVYCAGFSEIRVLGSDRDVSVAKYDASGNEQWSVTEDSGDQDVANDLDVRSSEGTLLVVGKTKGSLHGESNPSGGGNASGLVISYDLTGAPKWTEIVGTSEFDVGFAGAVAPGGQIYVGGKTGGDLAGASQGGADIFTRRYTGTGALKWTEQVGSSTKDSARGGALAVVGGNVQWHLAGYASDSLPGAGTYNGGPRDAFTSTYSPSGSSSGTTLLGTGDWDAADEVVPDGAGGVYVVGSSKGDFGGAGNAGSRDLFVTRVP